MPKTAEIVAELPTGAHTGGSAGLNPTHRPILERPLSFAQWVAEEHPGFTPLTESEEVTLIGGTAFQRPHRTGHEKGRHDSLRRRKEEQATLRTQWEKACPERTIGYRLLTDSDADQAYGRAQNRRWHAIQKSSAANQQSGLVEAWNEEHQIGTNVRFWTGRREGEGRTGRTRSVAQLLSGHTAVVWVEGHAGCVALSHIEAITDK